MKTESINEYLKRGGAIKKVHVDPTWKIQDLPGKIPNAKKYQSNGGRAAKGLNSVFRRTRGAQ